MRPDYLSLASVTFITSSYYTCISASFLPSPINQHLSFTFFFTAFFGRSFFQSYVSHHTPLNFIHLLFPPSLLCSQPPSRFLCTSLSAELSSSPASSKPSLVTASFTFTFTSYSTQLSCLTCFFNAFLGHSHYHIYVFTSHSTQHSGHTCFLHAILGSIPIHITRHFKQKYVP